jgi:hypothetical protein
VAAVGDVGGVMPVSSCSIPSGWLCEPAYYDEGTAAGALCDCGCGVADPDCLASDRGLTSMSCAAGTTCAVMDTACLADACFTCRATAMDVGGACHAEADACSTSIDCTDFLSCSWTCADATACAACGSSFPTGAGLAAAVSECLCGTACGSSCQAECP